MKDFYTGKLVCVTGGAGFVGSNLVNRLSEMGAYVTIIDDLFTGDINNIESRFYRFHRRSVADFNDVDIFKEQDIIFHLAARNIIASTKNPIEDYNTNIGGTLNILMATRNTNVQKMVYTSSASVYGNPKYLPINEDDGINLLTPYAVSKYAGEGYCMAFYESYRLPITVLRLSNVYGPRQSPSNPYCGVVAKFMDKIKSGGTVEIHGDGLSTRDFTYIDDVVDALLLAGEFSKADGEVFNVATGIETSINTLVDRIGDLYEYQYPPAPMTKKTYIDRRDIDNIRRRVMNVEKIRRKLGWTPKITLEDGLRLTKEWMDRHG